MEANFKKLDLFRDGKISSKLHPGWLCFRTHYVLMKHFRKEEAKA